MSLQQKIKPWIRPTQKTYIFLNANVVDPVNGSILENQTVKIAGGLVESVTVSSSTTESTGNDAITIDLQGKYICPGLIDCHVHLLAVPGVKELRDVVNIDGTVASMRQPFVCNEMLRRGFTSVRDCGGATLPLKEAINEGVFPGPRLFISGHALSQTGGHGDMRGPHDHTDCCGGTITGLGRICDGVAECVRTARDELRCGADFIKIMGGGGVASPTDRLQNTQFTTEEIKAITEVARSYHTFVTAHAYTPQAIRHCVDNGVTGIEHGNLIDEDTAKYLAERDVFLTPTLITYSEMASPEWTGFLPPESAPKNADVLKVGLQALRIATAAGVTLCYGSDLLGPLGAAQTKEFRLRSQVLSATQILQSATVNAARMLRQDEFLGQIKAGFSADLLVLNKNPLEDILVFDNPEKHLLAVVKEGRVEASRWSKLPEDVTRPTALIDNARSRGPFRPRAAHKGTTNYQLRQFAEATLGSGSLRKAVRLPEGEDLNEWLAVNVVDFYNQINLLYGSITEFCSPQSCPEMKATDEFEYLWQDSENFKRPTKMPAPEYVEHLMAWVQSNIDNEQMFPSRIGVPFPKTFPSLLRQLFKRLYRVYAHIYCHHYPVIVHLGLEPHLNTSFKHYVLFVDEHSLASGKDFWGPLGDLVESMLRSD
ncbi:hypothetical protein FQN52_001005 [Onygenales sp. PD_12]|nr:hypothetical protein FQN52_001005 [Onygenales sp. PD_12]